MKNILFNGRLSPHLTTSDRLQCLPLLTTKVKGITYQCKIVVKQQQLIQLYAYLNGTCVYMVTIYRVSLKWRQD